MVPATVIHAAFDSEFRVPIIKHCDPTAKSEETIVAFDITPSFDEPNEPSFCTIESRTELHVSNE